MNKNIFTYQQLMLLAKFKVKMYKQIESTQFIS